VVVLLLLRPGKITADAAHRVPTARGSAEDAKDYHSDAGSSHSTGSAATWDPLRLNHIRRPSLAMWQPAARIILPAFAATRLSLALIGVLALSLLPLDLKQRAGNYRAHQLAPKPLEMWARWDAEWYLTIAEKGTGERSPRVMISGRPCFLFTPCSLPPPVSG
jgi:hypothetical protein